jgi:hypothetical protein
MAASQPYAYGQAHRVTRAAAVAAFRFGQPCAIGGEPLCCHPRWLDLAHDHVNGGYLGLSCRRHNRGEGASRGNRQRGWLRVIGPRPVPPPIWTASRDW